MLPLCCRDCYTLVNLRGGNRVIYWAVNIAVGILIVQVEKGLKALQDF